MSRHAYIVLGPANSGTRLFTRIFLGNGAWGNRVDHTDRFTQRLDDGIFPDDAHLNLVWKTHNCTRETLEPSKQYGNQSIYKIVKVCKEEGYDPFVFLMYRDVRLNSKAMVRAGYKQGDQAFFYKRLFSYYRKAFAALEELAADGVQVYAVNYDLFLKHPLLSLNEINNQCGLTLHLSEKIRDANVKHWDKWVDYSKEVP